MVTEINFIVHNALIGFKMIGAQNMVDTEEKTFLII